MKHCWFKIWLVGNGGAPYGEKYVFWPDYNDPSEMAGMVEHELSHLIGGDTRSVNWDKQKPSREVIVKRIERLKRTIENAQNEIKIHQKDLDNPA